MLLIIAVKQMKKKKEKERNKRERMAMKNWQHVVQRMSASLQKPHARSALLTLNPDLYADLLIPSRVPFSFSH